MAQGELPRGPRRAVEHISTGLDVLQRVLVTVVTVLVASSALLLFWQVVDRLVFSGGQNWIEEFARLSLVWMTFLGAAALVRERRHLAVDYVVAKLPDKVQAAFSVGADVLLLGLAGLLLAYAAPVLEGAAVLRSPSLGLPRSVLIMAAVVSLVLTAVFCVESIARTALGLGAPRSMYPEDDEAVADTASAVAEPVPDRPGRA